MGHAKLWLMSPAGRKTTPYRIAFVQRCVSRRNVGNPDWISRGGGRKELSVWVTSSTPSEGINHMKLSLQLIAYALPCPKIWIKIRFLAFRLRIPGEGKGLSFEFWIWSASDSSRIKENKRIDDMGWYSVDVWSALNIIYEVSTALQTF